MNKHILLAVTGLSLAVSAQSFADVVMDAGLGVSYEHLKQTVKEFDDNSKTGTKANFVKLQGDFNALINEHIALGAVISHSFGLGKGKEFPGNEKTEKTLHRNHLQLKAGYKFDISESFAITPMLGWDFQSISKFEEDDSSEYWNGPMAGIKFDFKASDDFTVGASCQYLWPKANKSSYDKRFNETRIGLDLGYNLDEQMSLHLTTNYKSLSKKFQSAHTKISYNTWDVGLGMNYVF